MKVKVFAPHGCDRSGFDERGWLEVADGSTVSDVLKIIRCGHLKAKLLMVSVNGVRCTLGTVLSDGDVIGFLMPIAGG